jgi:hypothetical protein
VFLATTYDPFDRVTDELRSKGISAANEREDGNLGIIVYAVRAYQIETCRAMKLGKCPMLHATRGVKVRSIQHVRYGFLLFSERIETLMQYEKSAKKDSSQIKSPMFIS